MSLKRNGKITITTDSNVIQDYQTILKSSDDYFIYMKNAYMKKDGTIVGRYLGDTPERIIDGYCHEITYVDGVGYHLNNKKISGARMLAVKNNGDKQVIIIIE